MLNYLTRDEFLKRTKELEGDHWTPESIERRWDYHHRVVELLKSLNINEPTKILEMGTMGITCVKESQTIDFLERWDFEGKSPTYPHDARNIPWPIEDKQFEVFIALRVYQHLVPKQKEAFQEALRIAKKVIIVVDPVYNNSVLPQSKGITYNDFVNFYDGVHPNIFTPIPHGNFFYWDTEIPSQINLEKLIYNTHVTKTIKTPDLNQVSLKKLFAQRLKQKFSTKK